MVVCPNQLDVHSVPVDRNWGRRLFLAALSEALALLGHYGNSRSGRLIDSKRSAVHDELGRRTKFKCAAYPGHGVFAAIRCAYSCIVLPCGGGLRR